MLHPGRETQPRNERPLGSSSGTAMDPRMQLNELGHCGLCSGFQHCRDIDKLLRGAAFQKFLDLFGES